MTIRSRLHKQIVVIRFWNYTPFWENYRFDRYKSEIASQGVDIYYRKNNKVLEILNIK
jgi:hypothetical protein